MSSERGGRLDGDSTGETNAEELEVLVSGWVEELSDLMRLFLLSPSVSIAVSVSGATDAILGKKKGKQPFRKNVCNGHDSGKFVKSFLACTGKWGWIRE